MPEQSNQDLPGPASGESPAGLYLHIPFCKSKCLYCAFDSRACAAPSALYLKALAGQIRHWAGQEWCRKRSFASLFIGGGTPTIYSGPELAQLVRLCLDSFCFDEQAEVTVESNPNSIREPDLYALGQAGVNRLSIGVQSLSDRLLAAIGRSHSAREAQAAVDTARRSGCANLNCDLIYGLPGQSIRDWTETLERTLALAPEHLACYELTVEEHTPLALLLEEGRLRLPDEDEVAHMAEICADLCRKAGFVHYEISNWARPGFECRHNLNYWQNGSYLGLGAAAVSCLSGTRIRNCADPDRYLDLLGRGLPPVSEVECLCREARFRETVVMGLRLTSGIPYATLQERFGISPPDYYGKTLEKLRERGLLDYDDRALWLTASGLPLANQVLLELV